MHTSKKYLKWRVTSCSPFWLIIKIADAIAENEVVQKQKTMQQTRSLQNKVLGV
jgi:hypothetical protein